mgnify:CR=1 FL=1
MNLQVPCCVRRIKDKWWLQVAVLKDNVDSTTQVWYLYLIAKFNCLKSLFNRINMFIGFFIAFDFCRFCLVISVFSSASQRPITSDFEWFLYQILSITLFSYLNFWERASISLFQCWVLNKGTTGTIFKTSLVWRSPWLGIEPGTSRTMINDDYR